MSFAQTFPNLTNSLNTARVLKAYNEPFYLTRAAKEVTRGSGPNLPQIVYKDDKVTCVRTSSYARCPGEGIDRLEKALKHSIPDDFKEFHTTYAEALIVTRTFPVHIWSIDKIVEELEDMRDEANYPLRFIRFGDQWDLRATQYALWQRDPNKPDWIVVSTDVSQRDDDYDDPEFTDYYKLGDSFSSWIEDWIARDGLPDPFMKLGTEGGFLDPV